MNASGLIRRGWFMLVVLVLTAACSQSATTARDESVAAGDYPRGPHNGRLLSEGAFAIEIAIFETGVPPEFHAWPLLDGVPLDPAGVDLSLTLTRLDATDVIDFIVQDDYLRGTSVVYEPHSFSVQVDARYRGQQYRWHYDSIEGRTLIQPALRQSLDIATEIAGPGQIRQLVNVVGRTRLDPEHTRRIQARFDGLVKAVHVAIGEQVTAGQPLLVIESNESLQSYTIEAPLDGVVTQRAVNPGEQSAGRVLLELADATRLWVELAVYPADRAEVEPGAAVELMPTGGGESIRGRIQGFAAELGPGQSLLARVPLRDPQGRFTPGTFVSARIDTGSIEVPLAVRREGLQSFRDFTVVYAKVGDQYEVRMLELGRQDDEWVEVLGGLAAGTEYVTRNSYIIKADIEKSGASHDH